MSVRCIEFSDEVSLQIKEQTNLADHAGAVVWDASIVLAHAIYLSSASGAPISGEQALALQRLAALRVYQLHCTYLYLWCSVSFAQRRRPIQTQTFRWL